MIAWNQNMVKKNCIIWIGTDLLSMWKQTQLQRHCGCWKKVDTSSYDIDRPLPLGKNKKVIWLIKDELRRQIMKLFVGLRAKI